MAVDDTSEQVLNGDDTALDLLAAAFEPGEIEEVADDGLELAWSATPRYRRRVSSSNGTPAIESVWRYPRIAVSGVINS